MVKGHPSQAACFLPIEKLTVAGTNRMIQNSCMNSAPENIARPIALVTGASGGIGRACAIALASAKESLDVVVHFNSSPGPAQDLAVEITTRFGVRACAMQSDLGKPGAAEKLIDDITTSFGPPTMLVHAAGHIVEKPIAFTKPEEWDALFEVHVYSALALTKAMARYLRKTERGRIVYIGSLAGRIGLGNGAAYAAAKGSLDGLCKSFALEAARWKTTVNVIAPGFVETHMTQNQGPERKAAVMHSVPLGRYGTSDEIASLAAYLCSTGAAYVTGQTIVMDGGTMLG